MASPPSPPHHHSHQHHQEQHHQHQHQQHQQHQQAMISHRPIDHTTSNMDPSNPQSSSSMSYGYSDHQQPRYDASGQGSQYLPRPPVLRPPSADSHYMSVAQPFSGSSTMAPYGLPAPSGQMPMATYHHQQQQQQQHQDSTAAAPFPSYHTQPYPEPSSFFHGSMPTDNFSSRSFYPMGDMNPPYLSTSSRGSSRSGLMQDAPERPSSLGSLGRSQSYASLQIQPRPASSSSSSMSMPLASGGPMRRPATMHGHHPDPRSLGYGSFGSVNDYAQLSRNVASSSIDPYGHAPVTRHRVTTTLWEDEGTLCFQVDSNGICVARRHDNNMINGTKLLNVCDLTRGKRDAILKSEKERAVVKVGAMHLKGVWISFDRARELARLYGIQDRLYPLFEPDIQSFLYQPDSYPRAGTGMDLSRDRRDAQLGKGTGRVRTASEADSSRDLKRPSSGVKRNFDSFATPAFGQPVPPSLARSNTAPALPRSMAAIQRGYNDVPPLPGGRMGTSASPSLHHAEPDRRYDTGGFDAAGNLSLSTLPTTRTSPDAYRRFSPMSSAPLSASSQLSSDHALRRILHVHDNGSNVSTPSSAVGGGGGGINTRGGGLAAYSMPGESPLDDGREQRDYFPPVKRGRHDTATSAGSGEVSEAIEAAREKTYAMSLAGGSGGVGGGPTRASPAETHAHTSSWASGRPGGGQHHASGSAGNLHDATGGGTTHQQQDQPPLWSLGGGQTKEGANANAYAQALLSTPSLQ